MRRIAPAAVSNPPKRKRASETVAKDSSKSPPREEGDGEASAPRPRRRVSKEDVLREATRLFAEKGYDGLSMADLAKRVGLRKASLFHHFATKEGLYERVLGGLVSAVHDAISRSFAGSGTTLEKLDALSDALTAVLGEQPDAARLLLGEALHGGPMMSHSLRSKITEQLSLAREFVRAGQREGVFDCELDPSHVVLTLLSAHFLPFAIEEIVDGFVGTLPRHAAFIATRTVALREQSRRILGARR